MPFISRTDDPIADYDRYDAEQQRELKRLPRCNHCDCHIRDETAYYIDGEWICEECMDSEYKRQVEPED